MCQPQHSMSAVHIEGLGLDIGWVLDIMFFEFIENVECYRLCRNVGSRIIKIEFENNQECRSEV